MAISTSPRQPVRTGARALALALAGLVTAGCMTSPTTPPAANGPDLNAYGVNTANQLVRFNTRTPGTVASTQALTGLQPNETVVGLDFRSAAADTGLYALGSTGRLYRVNTTSGEATAVGQAMDPALTGATQGFDFNPAADRLRVASGTANRRAHPDTGAVVDADTAAAGTQLDGTLAYDAGDRNAGKTPNVVAAAYTNPDADAATGTTNFCLDAAQDALVTQGTREGVTPAVSPNTGRLYTVGALNVDAGDNSHLDIARGGQAVAVLGQSLYTIDLTSGQASLVGTLAAGELRAFALSP